MHDVRSEDTNSLKSKILPYLLLDTKTPLDPPIVATTRATRGLNHPVTASLLCPLKYPDIQEYAHFSYHFSPVLILCLRVGTLSSRYRTYDGILAGKLPLTADMLPRFLYPQGQAHNPADVEDGMLRGHLVLRVRSRFSDPAHFLKILSGRKTHFARSKLGP